MIPHRAYDFCTDGKKDRRERCGAGVGGGRAELDKRIIDGGKRIKKETKKKDPVEARHEREDEAC